MSRVRVRVNPNLGLTLTLTLMSTKGSYSYLYPQLSPRGEMAGFSVKLSISGVWAGRFPTCPSKLPTAAPPRLARTSGVELRPRAQLFLRDHFVLAWSHSPTDLTSFSSQNLASRKLGLGFDAFILPVSTLVDCLSDASLCFAGGSGPAESFRFPRRRQPRALAQRW